MVQDQELNRERTFSGTIWDTPDDISSEETHRNGSGAVQNGNGAVQDGNRVVQNRNGTPRKENGTVTEESTTF